MRQDTQTVVGAQFLATAWSALGGPPLPPEPVQVTGHCGLASPLPVAELAVGAVAAQLLAARALNPDPRPVALDGRHVGFAFRSERFSRCGTRPLGRGFAPLSRFFRTRDGWLRLHANYPHHRAAAQRVLGPGDPDAAAARWDAAELEAAVVEEGGAAAAVRTRQQWDVHRQGVAVASLPVLELRRVADGPPRAGNLIGLRVLDLTRVIAGPVAGRTLASHGADVLRVDCPRLPEDPDGLLETGPGKRHAIVDFATRAGRATAEDLLREADVVLQGYRPGALDAFGLDPQSLTERHPHLAVVRLSAWSRTGPWAGRRGFDSLVQAATGIATKSSTDGVPGALPAQALDHATGHLAAAAALSAVRHRREGGVWCAELSLAQLAQWLLHVQPAHLADGEDTDPTGGVDPYLVELPSPVGPVTLVAPPGSPTWRTGPVPAGHDRPQWLTAVPADRPPDGPSPAPDSDSGS